MGSEKIAIIGGGLMGSGIAQVFAVAGHHVTICEPNAEVRETIYARIDKNLQTIGKPLLARNLLTLHDSIADTVGDADVVIEAVSEILELKCTIFSQIEQHAHEHAIIASNTSVIPITQIVEKLETKHRMIGTHWWNPPYLIPLVEVVRTKYSEEQSIEHAMDLLKRVGKMPVRVEKDVPGFVGNRLQHALWREAHALISDGICDAETVDIVVKNSFGMRLPILGPIENADLVGLDLTLNIHKTILPTISSSGEPNPQLVKNVESGILGFKTGQGFRKWTPEQMDEVRAGLLRYLVKIQKDLC